jgi:transcription termination factor Rho
MQNERDDQGTPPAAAETHPEPHVGSHGDGGDGNRAPPPPLAAAPVSGNFQPGQPMPGSGPMPGNGNMNGGNGNYNGQQQGQQFGDNAQRQGKRRRRRRRRGGGGPGGQPNGQQNGQAQSNGQQSPNGQQLQSPQGQFQGQPQGQNQGAQPQSQPMTKDVEGVLEIDARGNGALRRTDKNLLPWQDDAEVPRNLIQQLRLRSGWQLSGQAVLRNGRWSLGRVDLVDGFALADCQQLPEFQHLTSVDPVGRIHLETDMKEMTGRVLDLIAPVGFGQRGLIVAAPRTGKTMILQRIAHAVATNHPKAALMVLLIDERPEEVTDMRRSVKGDVLASSSDRPTSEHLRIAEVALERARRLVEQGRDVVILLDSITRLARAYNKEVESSGRTLTGGVDSRALERPKRIFGSARKAEEGGSQTILATALVDTGSRMDEVIFEEFKGTGNMEIILDRQLAEKRIWPAINIPASGTRKEEKLFSAKEMEKVRKLRQALFAMKPIEAMEKMLAKLGEFRSNDEFLDAI